MTGEWELRKATAADLPGVVEFLAPFMASRKLLQRSEVEIQLLAANGFVVTVGSGDDEQIIGFGAVEVYSRKMGEVQCLAVHNDFRRLGIGKQIVLACVGRARSLGICELMAITSNDEFLRECGFDYALPDQKRALFIQTSTDEP